ncbi:unnamed protein product [Boreogadus saida]
MAEGTEYAHGHNMEDWNFEEVMVETDGRGYLYEPQYSDEQLRAMEGQEVAEAAAATAEADDLPAAERSLQWLELGGLVVPVLSLCANGHRTRVCLLPRIPAGPISSGRNHGIRGCHGHYRLPVLSLAIRAYYPAQDGQYRGYQETVDAQDVL